MRILFLCSFQQSKSNNGVHRFANEIIKGVRSKEPKTYDLFWNKQNGLVRGYVELMKNFLVIIKNVKLVHFVVLTPSNIPFLILTKIFKKKILITYHGNYWAEAPLTKQPLQFIPYWIVDKISRNIADMIVSPTSYLLEQMKINQKNIQVIPLPVNLELLSNSTGEDVKKFSTELVFASASNFNIKEKVIGLDLLVEVMDKITKNFHDIKLMVFGNGIYLDGFKTKYANNENIVFMGFREDFRDFLSNVDIYIHISGLDNQPYALIEALLLGKVVICNNLGGILETIEANNNYVVSLNQSSISQAIYSVIHEIENNPDGLQMKGNRNKEFARKRYSSDVISAHYLKLYNQLLSENH
jgi:glycosyltransferase involved in cell wall biosynthesis